MPAQPSNSFHCAQCKTDITTCSKKYHRRVAHQQQASVHRDGENPINVDRNVETNKFDCPSCQKFSNVDPDALRKHFSMCTSVEEEESKLGNNDYHWHAGTSNILEYPDVNLSKFEIVVNTSLRAVFCLICKIPILPPADIPTHVKGHLPDSQISSDIVATLTQRVALGGEIYYPVEPIEPVYGLPMLEESHFFCDECHHGYRRLTSLQAHQASSAERCPGTTYHKGYGQSISGQKRRIIEIQVDHLKKKSEITVDYHTWFRQGIVAVPDYSKMPVTIPEDRSNLSCFFNSDGWLDHVKGHTPSDLHDARRTHVRGEKNAEALRQVSQRYIASIQAKIQDNMSFGILKDIGSTDNDRKFSFRRLRNDSVISYSLVLHRLVYACIRFYVREGWSGSYNYPKLDPRQITSLKELDAAIDEGLGEDEVDRIFHRVCSLLFAHEKHEYPASVECETSFFSPVICFLVLHCQTEHGRTPFSSTISNVVAPVMYAIRTCIFNQVLENVKEKPMALKEAVQEFDRYLRDGHATPMGFAYNASCILRVIRQNEHNTSAFSYGNLLGSEILYRGQLITLTAIKNMVNGQLDQYHNKLRNLFFFGQEIPLSFKPDFEIEKLVDEPQNRTTGYTFTEDPRNVLSRFRDMYGIWLFGEEDHRTRFTVCDSNGMIRWKTSQALHFIDGFEGLQHELAAGIIFSAGPSARGSEIGRQLYREMPGARRNLGIVQHNVSLNSTTDKTSHQRILDRVIPHVLSREWAVVLLRHLTIYRPFIEYLVWQIFTGKEEEDRRNRYTFNLWPGLTRAMTSHQLSDTMGQAMFKYLGQGQGIKFWRNLTTVVLQHAVDKEVDETNRQYYYDSANMHQTSTSASKYGGNTSNIVGVDSRTTSGCVRVGYMWHRRIGLQSQCRDVIDNLSISPTNISSTAEVTKGLHDQHISEMRLMREEFLAAARASMSDNMAEFSLLYFPPPPRPQTSLPVISDVDIHPSRLAAFRLFMNDPNAHWSCAEQALFVESIVRGRENIMGILGTGFGKTTMIMFISVAFSQGKCTVVVMPLAALHEDFHNRARAYGLKACRWSRSGKFDSSSSIITAAVEDLMEDGFVEFLMEKSNKKELYRVGFEEIHKLWSDKSYRPAFEFIHRIAIAGVPVFATSGSVPEHILATLPELTGTVWRTIRMASNRKELVYEVRRIPSTKTLQSAIVDHWKAVSPMYKEDERAIVFCRTINDAKSLGEALGVAAYHRECEDDTPVTQFIKGESKILPTTLKLGCGFHYPHIRDVLHMNLAYSIMDQYQEDSRGGRDGNACRAITFISEGVTCPRNDHEYDVGAKAVYEWSQQTDQCLRIGPSLFLDGVATTCTLIPGAQLCQICLRQLEQPPPGSARRLPVTKLPKQPKAIVQGSNDPIAPSTIPTTRKSSEGDNPQAAKRPCLQQGFANKELTSVVVVARPQPSRPIRDATSLSISMSTQGAEDRDAKWKRTIEEPLYGLYDFFSGRCVICFLSNNMEYKYHSSQYCPSKQLSKQDDGFYEYRTKFNVPMQMCYGCGLHTGGWTRHGEAVGKTNCPYRDVFDRILYLIFRDAHLREPLRSMEGLLGIQDVTEYVRWMIREHREKGEKWPKEQRGQRVYNYHRLLILFYYYHRVENLLIELSVPQIEHL